MIFGIPFLIFFNANIRFAKKKLIWGSYIAVETLSTTKKIKFIDRKEFIITEVDKNEEAFVVYIASIMKIMAIYLFY